MEAGHDDGGVPIARNCTSVPRIPTEVGTIATTTKDIRV